MYSQPTSQIEIPLFLSNIQAGFPSPADDYINKRLDLNEYLIKHPAATIFVKATDDSMIKAGIFEGDLLIVDKSLKPHNKKVVLASYDGTMVMRRLRVFRKRSYLIPENPEYKPVEIHEDMDVEILGVVTNVIHPL